MYFKWCIVMRLARVIITLFAYLLADMEQQLKKATSSVAKKKKNITFFISKKTYWLRGLNTQQVTKNNLLKKRIVVLSWKTIRVKRHPWIAKKYIIQRPSTTKLQECFAIKSQLCFNSISFEKNFVHYKLTTILII